MKNIRVINDELFGSDISYYAYKDNMSYFLEKVFFKIDYKYNSIGVCSGLNNEKFFVYVTSSEQESDGICKVKELYEFISLNEAVKYAQELYLAKLQSKINDEDCLYNEKLFSCDESSLEGKYLKRLVKSNVTGIGSTIKDGQMWYYVYSYGDEIRNNKPFDENGIIIDECGYSNLHDALEQARSICILKHDEKENAGKVLYISEHDNRFKSFNNKKDNHIRTDVEDDLESFEFEEILTSNITHSVGISTAHIGDFKYYVVYWFYHEPEEHNFDVYEVPCLTFNDAVKMARYLNSAPLCPTIAQIWNACWGKKEEEIDQSILIEYSDSRQGLFNKYQEEGIEALKKELLKHFQKNKPIKRTLNK